MWKRIRETRFVWIFDKKKSTSLLAIIANGPQTCDNALQTLPRLETFLSHGWNTFHRYKAKKEM